MYYRGFTSDWGVNCEKREYVVLFIYYTVLVWGTFLQRTPLLRMAENIPRITLGQKKKIEKVCSAIVSNMPGVKRR